ncbi:amino acid ABC transporter substrate-binding protein, PAAT family [Pseudomonas guineae]|uniref:Amino acid ABC transporter substrate-binding protein, PAAT family n=1 Tax=Pseudomonas guineae TaxID=425504 RepID=A0A1I3PGH3_9PSED|nr:transporter substrate-binding domain-containing protein [Pseudomonas guineae]SFJ20106.1 amino acid ABC transporter substrate-binding protein, PAAT family [Pseudomonas guineae]
MTAAFARLWAFPRQFLFVWLLLALLPALASATCHKTLRWADDPPFSMQAEDGSVVGIYVDANREVLQRLGCQVQLRKLPWARALRELKIGRLDILPGAFKRPEREHYAYFSGTILPPSRNILFMHKEALTRWPVSQLLALQNTDFRLGAQINVSYGADFELLMRDQATASRVFMSANRLNLWGMVAKRRIDGVIADENTGAYEIHQLGLEAEIQPSTVVVSSAAAEVAFSKITNDQAFVQAYAKAQRELVADGSYQRIVKRYVLP